MPYSFSAKIGMLSLIVIIVLLVMGRFTGILISGLDPIYIAGMFSIILGVLLFFTDLILHKSSPFTVLVWFGRLLMVVIILLGFLFVFDPLKSFAKRLFLHYDLVAIGIYLIVLLIVKHAFNVGGGNAGFKGPP